MATQERRHRREQLVTGGDWLRDQRQRRGFPTAARLATALGIDRSLVYNWENGKHAPSEEIMPALAEQLEVTVDDVRRAFGMYVSETDDVPEPMSLDQIEDLIPFLKERRRHVRSKRVQAKVDETIQLLELARDDKLRQELLAYGEVRRRRA